MKFFNIIAELIEKVTRTTLKHSDTNFLLTNLQDKTKNQNYLGRSFSDILSNRNKKK